MTEEASRTGRRAVVTGLGIVSPLGRGAKVTMDRLLAGDRAMGPLSLFPLPTSSVQIAAEVHGLDVSEVAPRGQELSWSRTDTLAVVSAREALGEAGLDPSSGGMDLVVGGSTAGMFENELVLAEMARSIENVRPLAVVRSHPLSATADRLTEQLGPFRWVRTLCSACSSGATAIALGATWIATGASDRVLAGGADALCRLTYAGFGALGALDAEPCRPFDRRRKGLTLGEGAAFLVLEAEEVARARGAIILADLAGWSIAAEAHHITNPERSGRTAGRVMRRALERSGLATSDLDYVNAHGTGTQLNDAMETSALAIALGDDVRRVAVSSTKGQIGHTLAAAGAIEAAVCVMAVARGAIPPTGGLEEPAEDCALEHVRVARSGRVRAAMSNSFGFGGTDVALVVTEPGWSRPVRRRVTSVVVTGAGTVGPLGVLGTADSVRYVEPGPEPTGGAIAFQANDWLDLGRARRIDRAGRLIAAAAIAAGATPKRDEPDEHTGAIVGAAFGSVDASTVFMRRIVDKGAHFASPADFPNLVPSSPVGHASIYLGLAGPTFAMADLGATPLATIVTAAELCAAGEVDAIFAGCVEEASVLAERCLGPVCSEVLDARVRSEGCAVVRVERSRFAEERGARAFAVLAWWTSWRGEATAPLADVPPPSSASRVYTARGGARVDRVLADSSWSAVPRVALAERAGDHEGASGFAFAAAVAEVAAGRVDTALVLGDGPRSAVALVLTAAGS